MEPFYLCNSEIFGLSNSTAVIYNFLCRVNNASTGKSFYKRSNIAASCHVSESTVVRALRTLCAKGLLAVKRRFDKSGRQTSNNYILVENPQFRLDAKPSQTDPSQSANKEEKGEPKRPHTFPLHLSTGKDCLSPNTIKVYSYLSYRAGTTGQCMPSKKEIADDCSISQSTVWRALHELISANLIEICRQTRLQTCGNNGTSVNLYVLKSMSEAAQAANPSPIPAQGSTDNLPVALFNQKYSFFYRLASFFCSNDTLPHFTGDTPRTRSRKKVTVNPRKKSNLDYSYIENISFGFERVNNISSIGMTKQAAPRYFSCVNEPKNIQNGESSMNDGIIGLPVLISARFRIVLDQTLCRLYHIPENGTVNVKIDNSALSICYRSMDTTAIPKKITIGRFNLPMQWVRENQVRIGDYVYLMPTEFGIEVRSCPWQVQI